MSASHVTSPEGEQLRRNERQVLGYTEGGRPAVGKPETFNFLGFTFICSKSRTSGSMSGDRKPRNGPN